MRIDCLVLPWLVKDSLIDRAGAIESFGVYLNQYRTTYCAMARQSITLTQPNDDWLNDLVMRNEYASKSEVVNDLIRRAREEQERLQLLRLQLQRGEESGFIEVTKEELQNALRKSLDEDNDVLNKP